ncbi:hypothetical protein [Bacillus sp. FJAT-27225]|nr:hypothetical protein [Bacillus sp. FJAT-27225]
MKNMCGFCEDEQKALVAQKKDVKELKNVQKEFTPEWYDGSVGRSV